MKQTKVGNIRVEGIKTLVWIICSVIILTGIVLIFNKKAEKGRKNNPDLPPVIKSCLRNGRQYEKNDRYENAINEYEKCLSLPNAAPANKVILHILIGNDYFELFELKKAMKHYVDALHISKKVKNKREKLQGKAAALNNIGLVYKVTGTPDEALKYFKKARVIAGKIGYRQGEVSALGNIGLVYLDKETLDEALKYHKEALAIVKETGYPRVKATAFVNPVIVCLLKGDPDEALKYLKEGLVIYRERGDRPGEDYTSGKINIIYEDEGTLDEALTYLKEGLIVYRERGYRQREAIVLTSIGLIYKDKGELDEATKYLKEALTVLDKHHLTYGHKIVEEAISGILKGG